MANKKKSRDMQGLVVGTILVLVLALGVYGVINQFTGSKQEAADKVYPIDYKGQPFIGKENAPVKIMEFGDFKCPVCKQFHDTIFPRLKKDFVDTGKVSFYFTNTQVIGPDSLTAGEAGEAVFKQNPQAFWKYYDAIYKQQGNENVKWATPAFLVDLIKKNITEVDANKVSEDLTKKTFEKETLADNTKYNNTGINGVPLIMVNGKQIQNGLSYSEIKAAIEKELQAK
ncbi:DsbA family protein [Shimazuella sp. AN120528]|uniref:thioredoxin domain-containing protein n=1 Tax=Shimazuella soli TaxID=1892854 RepID=UPI001F0F4513|nr:DsbA family protein [Shimazuella soli]